MPQFSNFENLAAYLLVYMAHVDGQVHYLEQASLKEQLSHFTRTPDQLILQASKAYDSNPTASVEEVMKGNETLIENVSFDQRMDLIESLYGIINSDGRVQEEEMRTLRDIRTALEQSQGALPVS